VNGGLARHGHRRASVGGGVERTRCWRVGLHARLKSGEGPAETQDGVRTPFSGPHIGRKAVRGSRDRGCKGHRILRRVLVGGRLLGSSRAIPFHEAMVTVTLAASSLGVAATLVRAEAERTREGGPHPGQEGEATEESEARSVCWRRGKKTPTLRAHAPSPDGAASREAIWQARCPVAVRRSVRECRETLGPPVKMHGAQDSVDVHAVKTAERAGNTRGTGTRLSFRWQKSVGRIARLVLREVARPVGPAGR